MYDSQQPRSTKQKESPFPFQMRLYKNEPDSSDIQKAFTRRGLGQLAAAGSTAARTAARIVTKEGPAVTADPTTPYTVDNAPKLLDKVAAGYAQAKEILKRSKKTNDIDSMPLHEIYNRLSKAPLRNSFNSTSRLLAKGRGAKARQANRFSGASQYSESDFPTGRMTDATTDSIQHVGVFGEKRHILVVSTRGKWNDVMRGNDKTHIDWVHIEPGTKVEPHHVTEIFRALRDAGYTKPMTWEAKKDYDEIGSDRSSRLGPDAPNRRDRFFRPFAAQWDDYVAAQQGKSAAPAEPAEPAEPAAPAEPAEPAKPAKPAKPAETTLYSEEGTAL